jgi:uncharacterized protein YbjT (DUF2867 family)
MSISRKIVVIGGTGLIGSKAVALLRRAGHDAIVASPSAGVNTLTGEGLDEVLGGADAVIDVSNLMSFDEEVIRTFFSTSTINLIAAEKRAGVRHHVILSIVGTDRLTSNPYISGKQAQEEAVKASGQDYTIVRATQFYEFLETLVDAYTTHGSLRVPDTQFQPIAADDVAETLVSIALGEAHNATIDLAGPERAPLSTLLQSYLAAKGDNRSVTADATIGYFGATLDALSLVPAQDALMGGITLTEWHSQNVTAKQEENL